MSEITQADWDATEKLWNEVEVCTCDKCHVFTAEIFARHRMEERAKIVAYLRREFGFGSVAADRIEAQAAEIKAILDREADTYRRHDAKVDALEAENERLRETLRDVTPPAYFGESEQSKARWAKARAALGDTK